MTWRFGPGLEAYAERGVRGRATPDELNHLANRGVCSGSGIIFAIAANSVLLGGLAAVALAPDRADATPNALPALNNLVSYTNAQSRILHLAQAQIARFQVSDISAPPGAEIPVRIDIPEDTVQPVHILLVRGLPEGFALSKAVRVDDAWAVSPQQLKTFSLLPPRGYEGRFDLEFVLIWGPERTREIRTVPVLIGTETPAEAERIEPGVTQSSVDAGSPSTSQPATARTLEISPEAEKAMLDRALSILQNGDIAAARLLFQRLADKGSARGALAMAKTYDPEVLTGMNVFGLAPEPDKAAQWYARAAEMGNEQARERLATLSAQ
jgi:hypothetical protein